MTWCVKILTFLGCALMTYFFGYSVLREEAIAYFFSFFFKCLAHEPLYWWNISCQSRSVFRTRSALIYIEGYYHTFSIEIKMILKDVRMSCFLLSFFTY